MHQIPKEDGAVTIVPPAETLPQIARANAALRASYGFDVLGTPAATLAGQVRAELLALAAEYTTSLGFRPGETAGDLIVATGHQPVLPHPGIWLKNHLAWRVAQQIGAASVNFIVDNDTVDLGQIKVPALGERGLEARAAPFVPCPRGVAAEEITVRRDAPGALAEAARLAGTALPDTLADDFVAAAAPADSLADFVSRPRRQIEEGFGVRNLELPVSRLCSTDGFLLFCAHIAADAERFVSAYNRALARHRAEHNVTNPVEPVPDLGRKGDRLELPFWVWREGEVRRPMLVAGGAPGAVREAVDAGLKIRPRALAMTMFFRLFCCDLFVHGMGGARYEPVNDAIIREFFGAEPPAYVAASATLLVKPGVPVPSPEDVLELRQRIRRMRTTPERFVDELAPDDAEARDLARRRVELRDLSAVPRRERKSAFVESKKLASQLQERIEPHILAAEQELARAEELRAALEDREYPFFLHPRAALEKLYELPALGTRPPDGTAQGPRN